MIIDTTATTTTTITNIANTLRLILEVSESSIVWIFFFLTH